MPYGSASVKRYILPLVAIALVAMSAAATDAHAQVPTLQLGARGSTLGLGPELTVGITRWIGVRSSYHALNFTRDFSSASANYSANPNFKGFDAFIDLHPFGGHFRLTGGLVSHTAALNLIGTPKAGTITVNDVDYPTSMAGDVVGKVTLPKQAQYAGLGFEPNLFGRSRFGIAFDIGALHQKVPTTTLSATGPLASDPGSAGQAFRAGSRTREAGRRHREATVDQVDAGGVADTAGAGKVVPTS
jgi:hypothetical protein